MVQKIIKFERIINYNESSMLQIFILYCMSCHDNYIKLNNTQKEKILGFIYTLYMTDDSKTDISTFSDIVMANYEKVLNNEFTKENIYNYI